MSLGVPARLGLFAAGLVVVFGAAAALGAGVDPGQPAPSGEQMSAMEGMGDAMGVVVSDGDYRITPATFQVAEGAARDASRSGSSTATATSCATGSRSRPSVACT